MMLSPNFSLEELTLSQTASRKNITNTPTPEVLACLTNTAAQLEKIRKILGVPVHISSGYRSPEVNRLVGGATKSQHLTGEAVDFTAPQHGTPREIVKTLRAAGLEYDQLILEFDRWVHVSFSQNNNRKQALVIDNTGTRIFA